MVQTPLDFPTNWAYAWSDSEPLGSGKYRSRPEDFCVDEVLGFEPEGIGEHVFVQIEKVGQNTLWVIDEMASQIGVEKHLFGHSGLKDRHALTTQWVSIQHPKSEPDFKSVQIPGVRILRIGRHPKKLRPGVHQENQFQIVLRELCAEPDHLESILARIMGQGFPNYFGDQRFGFDGQNLSRGWELLESRRLGRHKKKGIYLSALRSFLFNKVLSARVLDKLIGETEEFDQTGPMWGRGRSSVSNGQQGYEQAALHEWQLLCEALEFSGLNQERRALMVTPEKMHWEWSDPDQLRLEFSLPAGSYATSLLRELGEMVDISKQEVKPR